jgi:hypothetical protein
MGKGSKTSMDVLAMLLTGAAPDWIGADRYLSLHTEEPGAQDDSEVSYEGYRRKILPASAWEPFEDGYTNHDVIAFPISVGADTPPITHMAIGLAAAGPGQILYAARIRRPFKIRFNDRVEFQAGSINIVEV